MPDEYLPKPQGSFSTELPKELPEHSSYNENEFQNNHEVKTLLSWTAPGRPFAKRTKDYFLNTILITLLISIILFLFHEYMLMLVIWSLVFVSFAIASTPPHNFHYRLSTEGLMIEDRFFLWQELYDFYFKTKDNAPILYIRTKTLLPGILTISLGDMHIDQVKNMLLPYLPYREVVKPTFLEKSSNWLSKNFPLEQRKNH